VPVKVRDQVIGVLGFRKAGKDAIWTQREMRVLELVVAELSDALVAAQLYQDAQSNAVRQQIVGELSSRMRQTLDVEAVLRTAAAEVRQALGLSDVVVRLQVPSVAEGDASVESLNRTRA
jgi:GAF domain-containing protein